LTAAAAGAPLSTLHPLAHLRTVAPARQGRARYVTDQNAEHVAAGLARGGGRLAGSIDEFKIVVESVDDDIAAARIMAGSTRLHVHLLRQDGKWLVVTVLRCAEAAPSNPGGRGL
jgi:hypothetical protein